MKIIKTMMCKALRDGTDQYEALLELRNTPRQDTGIRPAEMMFGRNTRSPLPSTGTKSIPSKKQIMMKRAKRRLAIKSNYNKGARSDSPLVKKFTINTRKEGDLNGEEAPCGLSTASDPT